MSYDDLKKMGSHITNKQNKKPWKEYSIGTKFPREKPRWKEQSTPTQRHITFSTSNFKNNSKRVLNTLGKVRGKLAEVGEKYPNLRDPSNVFDYNPFEPFKGKKKRR